MKTIFFSAFVFSCLTIANAQNVELPETYISINSDYINLIDTENPCKYVKYLERTILNYSHNELSELYDHKTDILKVTFEIPKGKIIASFNKDGKIIKTYEKYKNIRLPRNILQTIAEKYPNYGIVEDTYIIEFRFDEDALKQEYSIKLKNNDATLTLKANKHGDII